MTVKAFAVSDVGRRRETNEDSFLLDQGQGLFAVADGMGGHAAGEVASRLAIDTLKEALQRDTPARSLGTTDDAGNWLRDAVVEANRRIWDSIRVHEERRGMGTTVVVLLRAGDDAVIGHVGDSRIYLLRGGTLHRMTSDHSWVNEQVKLGLLSDDEAQRHPMRNIVTRALGSRPDVVVDLVTAGVVPGDVFVLCSDGLNTMLTDDEIREILASHRADPEAASTALVQAANQRGGEDNVTVVVIGF
ncbi:MAG TPA: Stp1/IreP family PP2C-type Ser/Thr phosphatase [Candidatus Polarisedimenticolaceae bacterium]|nr:Stp1/IreP family PP2C-type Ser/Thr phosphatase [Candidatus Polarisedimenticolaceae bacterium]